MTVKKALLRKRRHRIIATIILLLVFLVGFIGAFAAVGWENAIEALSFLSGGQIFFLLGLSSLHYVLRALRWHLLALTVHLPTTLFQNFLHFFAGFALTATPGRLGELVRIRWMGGETGWSVERCASIALADRATELAGMVFLIVFCVAATSVWNIAILWLLGFSVIIVCVALYPRLLNFGVLVLWRMIGKKPRLFVRLRRMTNGLLPFITPSVLTSTIFMSAIGWFLEGLAFYLLLNWLEAPVPLLTATAIFLTGVLSGALSGLPGGLGGTEAAIVALLSLQGVSLQTALLATITIRVTTLWFAVGIGALLFPVAEYHYRKASAVRT